MNRVSVVFFAACFSTGVLQQNLLAQSTILDDFESFAGWNTVVSEGAKLSVSQGEGRTGKGLLMEFDLSGVYGYVVAQKDFHFDLPANYQFTFDLRAEAQVNNFEFKLTDDKENVFWIKKLMVEYPRTWSHQRIKKRHLSFAWGPSKGGVQRTVRKVEFVVSCGTGGTGKVWIDNFRFEPIDTTGGKALPPTATASSGGVPTLETGSGALRPWNSGGAIGLQEVTVDFHANREIGGVVIDWDSARFASAYEVQFSDDGKEWTSAYTVTNGNGGRDYVPTRESEGRFVRLALHRSGSGGGYGFRRVTFMEPRFSQSPNDLLRALAADAPRGRYPKYLGDEQSYWTVIGANGDTKEALINEQGQIEVDKVQFSLEPFLFVDDTLITWNDVTTVPSLLQDYLPIPSVEWNFRDRWRVRVQALAGGPAGKSLISIHYSVRCSGAGGRARFFVAIRPFQVNPPWQSLNVEGGVARIDSIRYEDGFVFVNGKTIIPMTTPSAFGASEFDRGEISEYLARGVVPSASGVRDHAGFASAALAYDLSFVGGEEKDICVAVPFHAWGGSPAPNMGLEGDPLTYHTLLLMQTQRAWESKLGRFQIQLPPTARAVANTVKSNLAYIFINRDGPGIQPGSRSYERSWIRDGSLTCAALLRTGNPEEVREFIDWYARGQFPSGKIPCVIDSRGPDAVPEHDSHGEFIFAVYQYFLFTKDTTWLRGKFAAVTNAVRYIQSLRAERKTEKYRMGSPELRACFGLVPESISHEGYWDVPRHSYWDDFFVLRGLKDATSIAGVLDARERESEFRAERDDFKTDLYASMRLAMQNTKIDYIPGCAELGDFDATSTTIGLSPGGELGNIPEPQLHATFDRYYRFITEREANNNFVNYTPYETRTIGSFVLLDQKQRAEKALNFFMRDRRPAAWNQWAEVVWRDPATPKFIGDMPHTWVGSDFIRSILTMFAYERERDSSLVLAAGIPDSWIADPAGIRVTNLPTPYGPISYTIGAKQAIVTVEISGPIDAARQRIVLKSPLSSRVRAVRVNGKKAIMIKAEVAIARLPARVEWSY
jgi:hypothetical protein